MCIRDSTFTAQSGSTIVTPKITLNTTGTTSVSSLMYDQFRLNTTLQVTGSTNATITANLERADTSGTDTILGTGMTESSGIFTFPSTGFYLVSAVGNFSKYGAAASYAGIKIVVTVDNSAYNTRAESYNYIPDVASAYGCIMTRCLVDVTDTTNVKVAFNIQTSATAQLYGHSSVNATHFMFQRVGDT